MKNSRCFSYLVTWWWCSRASNNLPFRDLFGAAELHPQGRKTQGIHVLWEHPQFWRCSIAFRTAIQMVCCFICRHENTSFLYVGLNTIPINHNHDRHNTHKILTLPLSTTQYCNLLRRRPKSLHSGRARCPKMRADAYSGNKAGGEPLTSGLCDAACRNSQVYIIVHIFMDMCNIHKYVHIDRKSVV